MAMSGWGGVVVDEVGVVDDVVVVVVDFTALTIVRHEPNNGPVDCSTMVRRFKRAPVGKCDERMYVVEVVVVAIGLLLLLVGVGIVATPPATAPPPPLAVGDNGDCGMAAEEMANDDDDAANDEADCARLGVDGDDISNGLLPPLPPLPTLPLF